MIDDYVAQRTPVAAGPVWLSRRCWWKPWTWLRAPVKLMRLRKLRTPIEISPSVLKSRFGYTVDEALARGWSWGDYGFGLVWPGAREECELFNRRRA